MAVADTFTAITEDRPYRKGMQREQVVSVLDNQALSGALDGDVVAVLTDDYDAIDNTRRQEQANYGQQQQRLADIIGSLQAAPA